MMKFIEVKKFWEKLKPFYCVDSIPSLPYPNEEMPWSWIVERLISCGAIPKKDLIPGKRYIGSCRNAHIATWNGSKFVYLRQKFGDTFEEEINHFEDDNGYDLFVPVWEWGMKRLTLETVDDWMVKEFGEGLSGIQLPLSEMSVEEIEKWAKGTMGRKFLRLGLEEYLGRKEK